jgi:hypothetical protein
VEQLAKYSLRSGMGPVGYRSKTHDNSVNAMNEQSSLSHEA